jgi:hypothetical protein
MFHPYKNTLDNIDYCKKDLLEWSIIVPGATLALSGEMFDNRIKPNPATFNRPPSSSKIFLAPYQNFQYYRTVHLRNHKPACNLHITLTSAFVVLPWL